MSEAVHQEKLLEVKGLKQYFAINRGLLRKNVGYIKAVDNLDLTVHKGETIGLVGESGCGKTTLGRSILRLHEPFEGKVIFYRDGKAVSILDLEREELRKFRRHMQLIFQDPYSSLNSRMTILETVSEPLLVHKVCKGRALEDRVAEMLDLVGLKPEYMRRYPHSFSGGQRQRICIARALILNPELVIADEAVSALDVSIQAQILNLLKKMQQKLGLTYIFISHDLGVVRYVSDRIAMMYVGKMVEMASTDELLSHPMHPYTESLLSAVPKVDFDKQRKRILLSGEAPDPSNLPGGCVFHERCHYTVEECAHVEPRTIEASPGHFVKCHRAQELQLQGIR